MTGRAVTTDRPPNVGHRPDRSRRPAREELITAASKLDGFEGGVWLVNRETSRFLSVTFWQSKEQLRESEETVSRLRELAMSKVGGTVESVECYEVVAQI